MEIPDHLPDTMSESSPLANREDLFNRMNMAMALTNERRSDLLKKLNDPTLDNETLRQAFIAHEELLFEIACSWYTMGVELLELSQQLGDGPERIQQTQSIVDGALDTLHQAVRRARDRGVCDVETLLARHDLSDIIADI